MTGFGTGLMLFSPPTNCPARTVRLLGKARRTLHRKNDEMALYFQPMHLQDPPLDTVDSLWLRPVLDLPYLRL